MGTVISKDGTHIGYRELGNGPAVVLVQGAMGTAANFEELADELAADFTVILYDRRGRGMSPARYDIGYSIQKDVDDLEILVARTGATNIFGLSSGAVIALSAALALPTIRKTAAFEPPFFLDDFPEDLFRRVYDELDRGRISAALISAMKATRLAPPVFNLIPRLVLESVASLALRLERRGGSNARYSPLAEMAHSLRFDFALVREMNGRMKTLRQIPSRVLLLGGSKSPGYLRTGLLELEKTIPSAKRVELPGLGHGAAWNSDRGGSPGPVAKVLAEYFRPQAESSDH